MPAIRTRTTHYVSMHTFQTFLGTKPCDAAGQQVLQQECKAASAVREMAAQVYIRMVDDCRDKSITFESLKAGGL